MTISPRDASASLSENLRVLSRFLPSSIVTSPSWHNGMEVADHLPALIAPYAFGFEAPLHLPLRNVDLALCVTRPGCDMLAGTFPLEMKSYLLADPARWPEIKTFCRAWTDPDTGLYRCVENLWLEFRLRDRETALAPVPFIKINNKTYWDSWLPRALSMLYGERIPEEVRNNLSSFLTRLPRGVRPFQAGIYRRGNDCLIRLCLEGMTAAELHDYPARVGLKDDYPFDDVLLKSVGRIAVHADMGRNTGTTIGVELRQNPHEELSLPAQGAWDAVLNELVRKKLCLPENAAFLRGFRGSSYEMNGCLPARFVTYRFLYYIKLVHSPHQPVEAKAYFGFVNRTAVPPLDNHVPIHHVIRERPSREAVANAARRGVAFLVQNQMPHGEFCAYIAHDRELRDAQFDGSPFATSFVLYCTRDVPAEIFNRARVRAKSFLLGEGRPGHLWRYWTRASGKEIVPDLDDTCCASFILNELFTLPEVTENVPAVLANRDENGLFKTWLRDKDASNDADAAVNANILLYLGERKETEAAISFIRECIRKNEEKKHCHYYPDVMALYYIVCRLSRHGIRALVDLHPLITKRILELRNPEGYWGDELSTALALCTLKWLGTGTINIGKSLLWLINRQHADGSWRRVAFYAGPEAPLPHSAWFGSEELTTAFCVEALYA